MRRCDWATNDLAIRYHDEEWGVPIHDDRKWLEFLILEGAQAGLSWDTILKKRERYRVAFDHFDPAVVARYEGQKVEALLADPGIIRNRLKVSSAIKNARAFLEVQREFGSFDAYIWRFVGSTICYAMMQATGLVNDHLVDCFRRTMSDEAGAVP